MRFCLDSLLTTMCTEKLGFVFPDLQSLNAHVDELVLLLQENVRQFYKKLLAFVTHRDQKIEVFSLSVITSLCLHDDIGDRVSAFTDVILLLMGHKVNDCLYEGVKIMAARKPKATKQ